MRQAASEWKPITIGEWLAENPEAMALVDRPKSKPDAPWHIVHVVGRSDLAAREWLDRLGFTDYYPMIRELRPVARRKLSQQQRAKGVQVLGPRIVPCFPRYIFVRVDLERPDWHELFQVAGVGGLVCEGGLPVAIWDSMVDDLRSQEVNGAIPAKITPRLLFKVGERVRIKDGPFAHFTGAVEKMLDIPIEDIDADTRIRIALDIFGQTTPMELDLNQVERAK